MYLSIAPAAHAGVRGVFAGFGAVLAGIDRGWQGDAVNVTGLMYDPSHASKTTGGPGSFQGPAG